MTNLITVEAIEKTKAYKNLDGFKKTMIVKRDNRAILERAFIHFNTTGVMLPQIGSANIKVLTEILEKDGKQNSKPT